MKLPLTGASTTWGTYLGGGGTEQQMTGMEVDASDNVYVVGYSASGTASTSSYPISTSDNKVIQSNNLNTTGTIAGLRDNVVFSKLNSTGTTLVYSTYLGGSSTEIDPIGNESIKFNGCRIYLTLTGSSTDFPLTSGAITTSKLSGTSVTEPILMSLANPPDFSNFTISPSTQSIVSGTQPAAFTSTAPSYVIPTVIRNGTNQTNGTSTAYPNGVPTVTGSYQWQSSTDGVNYTNVSGATAVMLTSAQMGTVSQTTYYRMIVSGDACSSPTSPVVTVYVGYAVSGNVYSDANGLSDNTVNGTAYAGSTTLYVVLYDNTTGQVAGVATVSGGTYSLVGKAGDSYTLYLTTSNSYTVGSTTAPTAALPSGWVSTGEHLGAGTGSDGTPNSILPLGTVSSNTTNANFGIVQCPNGLTVGVSSNTSVVCASAPSSVTLMSTPSGGITNYASYLWSGSGIGTTNTPNTTATPTATTTYSVTVTDAVGCTATGSTTVTYDAATPNISLTCGTNSNGINYGHLNETNGVSWLWTTTSGGRFYTDNTLSANNDSSTSKLQAPFVDYNGNYAVAISDASGCNGSGSITITSSSCTSILAVSNLNFAVVNQGNEALLNWSTASETSNSYFNIERSGDGVSWQVIGAVNGAGNSSTLTKYSFADPLPLVGTNYYRLKQVDVNGQYNYSPVHELTFTGQWLVKLYPNPVQNYIVLEFNNDKDEKANIIIQSVLGNTVFATGQQLAKGLNRIVLNQVQLLANGTYMVVMGTKENTFRSKFVKSGN